MGRIIAVPGERIRASDGEIFVNGKKISEAQYLKNTNREPFTVAEILVPAGHVFILVDNRAAYRKRRYRKGMRDSRHRGPIPIWAIKAKITSAQCGRNQNSGAGQINGVGQIARRSGL